MSATYIHDSTGQTLSQVLLELCQRVSGDLVRQRYLGKTVGIKLRYDDFHT